MLLYIYCMSPIVLSFIVCILLLITAKLCSCIKNKKNQFVIFGFFTLLVLLVIFYATSFTRSNQIEEIELRPLISFFLAKKQPELYRSFFMNILLFVPLGVSMPYMLSKKPRKWIVFIPIIFACVLSIAIEYLQYYYHLGRCETDDVIANTLGAAIGTLSYLLYIHILKNQKESLMNSKINDNQNLLMGLCGKALFDKEYDLPQDYNCTELVEEAVRQTVFSQIFSFVKENAPQNADKCFSQIVAKNIRVDFGHNEVHKALTENNIPYVVLKGVASASYYKEPMLRMMGDIDILVSPDNIIKADAALKAIGFVTQDELDGEGHIAYKRRDGLICELHREINGIPKNTTGDKMREYFTDIFDKSIEYKTSNGSCIVPSKLHHGIVLLLHTATHLTHEGVGLRHLNDWAVFVNSFSNDEFTVVFEKPLKEMGLWRFAQLLTLCCIKYLGCDQKEWTGQADNNLIDSIISDILNGGNFGIKDADRYNQIKYLSDRSEGTTAKKNPILQLFASINAKTKKEFKFVNKSKLFLPIGWIFTVCKYLYMVIMGKRRLDSAATISGAKQRKNIYDEFKLFENNL